MLTRTIFVVGALASACICPSAFAAERPFLDDASLSKVVAAAGAAIDKEHETGCIAVVNQDGGLLYLHRLETAPPSCVDLAIAKARTSAFFRAPSVNFAKRVAAGDMTMTKLPNAVPLGGGMPLSLAGTVVGAVGISTPVGADDMPAAEAAAKSIQ